MVMLQDHLEQMPLELQELSVTLTLDLQARSQTPVTLVQT
tara:strand:- start:301 stop:420 length:120 start_codon:yes stop_codon:yes gene_type:complete